MSRTVSGQKVRFARFVTGSYSSSLLLALLLLFSPGAALAQSTDNAPPGDAPKWDAHIDLQGKLGNKRDLGIGDLFLPLAQNSDTLLFGDIRGRFDDHDNQEGNFGLGLRHMLSSGWNIGGYGYFDRNSTSLGNDFNQLTFGAEALSLDWDVRANLYETVGPSTKNLGSSSSSTASLVGTTVDVTTVNNQAQEKALSGFDAEVGWRVPLFDADADRQLRVYLGGYRFASDDVRTVEGPRARFDFTVDTLPFLWDGSRLDLTGEVQHDGPRGTQEFAGLQIRIPLQVFGKNTHALNAQERRMADPVVRDVDIVSQTHTVTSPAVTETATATASGSALTVLSSSSTTGAALPGAITAAGANSTVILSGSFNTPSRVFLQSGQTVMGAGSLSVRTPSGHVATLTTSGATVSASGLGLGNSTITMNDNSTLMGMTVNETDSANAFSVGATDVIGAKILNNTINATNTSAAGTAYGIQVGAGGFAHAANETISGNTITAVGGNTAIAVYLNDGGATVASNTLSASGATAQNSTVSLNSATVLAGSSGNTAVAGTCNVASAGNGSTVTFTNAAACGP